MNRHLTLAEIESALPSHWTTVDGHRLHARVALDRAPDGAPAVVLVHGIGVSSRYMVPAALRLAPSARAYAVDLPGFGKSHKPRHALTLAELADALAAWVSAAGLRRPVLLANSFGCQIVVEAVVRHPGLAERVVLQGPTVDPLGRTVLAQLGRWRANGRHEPTPLSKVILADYADCGIPRLLKTFDFALRDPVEAKLPHVAVPALVVRGSIDLIVPQRWAEDVTRLLPDARLAVIPGAPHTINYTAPLELARVVRPFLERRAPAGQPGEPPRKQTAPSNGRSIHTDGAPADADETAPLRR